MSVIEEEKRVNVGCLSAVILLVVLLLGMLWLGIGTDLFRHSEQTLENTRYTATVPHIDNEAFDESNGYTNFFWRLSALGTYHRSRDRIVRSVRTQPIIQYNSRGSQSSVPTAEQWYQLFGCETGGTYNASINTGNGYYGAFQFDLTTWNGVGGTGYPHQFSYEVQRDFALKLWQSRGWSPWPKCSRQLGFR